jgi:hypothetical protein
MSIAFLTGIVVVSVSFFNDLPSAQAFSPLTFSISAISQTAPPMSNFRSTKR